MGVPPPLANGDKRKGPERRLPLQASPASSRGDDQRCWLVVAIPFGFVLYLSNQLRR